MHTLGPETCGISLKRTSRVTRPSTGTVCTAMSLYDLTKVNLRDHKDRHDIQEILSIWFTCIKERQL